MASHKTPNLDALREHVDKLKKLLDDPQPGMFTWHLFYAEHMEEISLFWLGDDYPKNRKRRDQRAKKRIHQPM